MVRVGFIHTSPVHIPVFEELIHGKVAVGDTVAGVHRVREDLLEQARGHGVDDATLREAVREQIECLSAEVDVIVCTCSTLGSIAEEQIEGRAPVLRIDRPMAADAVRIADRIGVVVAFEPTIGPTHALFQDECARQGRSPQVFLLPCLPAWSLFEAGDVDGYHRRIAAHVESIEAACDIVVLAQASMIGSLRHLDSELQAKVISSPASALDAAISHATRPPRRQQ